MPHDLLAGLRQHVRIDLLAVTHWVPDCGPPSADQPLAFALHASAGSVSYVASSARHEPLPALQADRLREAAEAALRDGDQSYGIDTAVGRFYTYLTLTVFDPERGARTACLSLNHHGGEEICDLGWSSLVAAAASLASRFAGSRDLRCWAELIERLPLPALPAPYEAGLAVRCPDDGVLPLSFDASFFLRVGQPPGPTSLIELRRSGEHVDVLLHGAGAQLLTRVVPARGRPGLDAEVPSLSNLDLLDLAPHGAWYRGAPPGALDAWRGDDSLLFRLFFLDARRILLSVFRPPLGLFVQRP